ncbi:MAG: FecR domain-containing protein [Actinomycetota bacterium]
MIDPTGNLDTEKTCRPFGWTRARVREAAEAAGLFLELRPDFIAQSDESIRRTRSALLDTYDRLEEHQEPAGGAVRPFLTARKAIACAAVLAAVGLLLFFAITSLTRRRVEPVARIRVLRGEVLITRPGEDRPVVASTGTPVLEEDRLETSGEGLAILEVDDGSEARLDGASALFLPEFSERRASMRLDRGRVYFNLKSTTSYQVLADGLAVETRGAAVFDSARYDGSIRTRVIEGEVTLTIESAPCGRVSGGEEVIVRSKDGERWVEVNRSDPGFLNEPWYHWNRLLDGMDGNADGSREPAVETAGKTPSGRYEDSTSPASGEIELPPPPDVAPGVDPSPVIPEPVAPEEKPEPPGAEPIEFSLSAAYDECGKIELNWTASGGDYDSIAIARSVDNAATRYPRDRKDVVARSASRYTDTSFERGHTYYYLLCALKEGKVRSRSEVRAVVVPERQPEPTYSLALSIGEMTSGEVHLSWTLKTTGGFEGYIIYREKVAGDTRDKIVIPSSDRVMSYSDSQVKAGTSYVYQVVVYSGGEILAGSDRFTVSVPEASTTKKTTEDSPPAPIPDDNPPAK